MARRLLGSSGLLPCSLAVLVMWIAVWAPVLPAQAPAPAYKQLPSASCYNAPEKFAIDFFRSVEAAPVSKEMYETLFALEFKRETTLAGLQEFLKSTHSRFGIDGQDKPLDARLMRPPAVKHLGRTPDNAEVMIDLFAVTARGRTQQHVEIVCQNQSWKVMRFSYEPDKY